LRVQCRPQPENRRCLSKERFQLGANFLPLRPFDASHTGLHARPVSIGKVGAEPSAEIRRFAHIQYASVLIEQCVHAWRRWSASADCVARSTPDLPPVFDDERLFDKAAREVAPRPAYAQDLGGKARVIRLVIHVSEPRQKNVPDHESSLRENR
jgi:hypothetical protein